jgi:hypothetical protein
LTVKRLFLCDQRRGEWKVRLLGEERRKGKCILSAMENLGEFSTKKNYMRAGWDMAQVVKRLSSKGEAPSSNPSTTKKQNNTKK